MSYSSATFRITLLLLVTSLAANSPAGQGEQVDPVPVPPSVYPEPPPPGAKQTLRDKLERRLDIETFGPPTAEGPHAKPLDPSRQENPFVPGDIDVIPQGFLARAPGKERFTFYPWVGEGLLNKQIRLMKRKEEPCEIKFLPGRYIIEQRIFINEVNNLTVTGGPNVELVFADGPDRTTMTTAPITKGATTIEVEHPERMRVGFEYQIYQSDGKNDRLLEFEVLAVHDGLVHLARPAHFMPHVKGIAAGGQVMEQVNFFRTRLAQNLVIQGFQCDGRNRGGVRAHTTYCGVYASSNSRSHERPGTIGLTVRNCSFKNLKGRGVVFYGVGEAVIQGNYFENIRAQAIEIDHFSNGHITGNVVNGAEVGVMVNDAFDSLVEGNILSHCRHGVRFLEIYDDDWVNTNNTIRDNFIGPGNQAGVVFFNEGMTANLIEGNHFIGLPQRAKVVNGEGNTIVLK